MNLHFPLFISFFLLFHKVNAFDITKILNDHPTFSNFNDYLTQTNLASQINSRETITVLAVANSNISPLSGISQDIQKNILSVHVVLDYFDVQKIQQLKDGSTTLTTLFQSTGLARGQQGFLNVTHLDNNRVAFGSAMQGAQPGSVLVESVASEPYNISVLHVSTLILPPGLDGTANSTSNNSTSTSSPSTSPSSSPGASPTPSKSPGMSPSISPRASAPQKIAPSNAPSNAISNAPSNAQTPTGSLSPTAGAPSDAQSPAIALSPTAAPGTAPVADAPLADTPVPNTPADATKPNRGTALQVSFSVLLTTALSSIFLAQRN